MPPLIERMIRAAKLDAALYEEVEGNTSLLREAALIVVIVALASGIGALTGGFMGLVWGIVYALAGWALWAGIIYFVGTRLMATSETHADWGQVARGIGYAQAPGVLRVFGFIPVVGGLIVLAAFIWQIVAVVTATRQVLELGTTGRAVGVVVVAAVPYIILTSLFFWLT